VFYFFKSLLAITAFAASMGVLAQDAQPTPTPAPTPPPISARPQSAKEAKANPTAETIAET
jgi:hypothetical protein